MRFTHAIVRPPAASFADGITASDLGTPDYSLALAQHDGYCRALERLGLSLVRLPPDPGFPDSTFVEDTALVAGGSAIVTRPGASSRAGEVEAMKAALGPWFPEVDAITAPGTLDAGDVCEAGKHFFIGRSHRTNAEGAAQLAAWLERQGFSATVVDIRDIRGLLHLKTGISWLGGRRLLVSDDIADNEALEGWDLVRVPAGEDYAANCVAVNGAVLVPEGFPKTAAMLSELGIDVVPLEMSEFRKMDGGLSCLSVRWGR